MKIILLDGKRMKSKETAHLYLKRKLNFPQYYGKNLDALWDMLSTISEPINIILFNREYLQRYLGAYGDGIIDVFQEAAEANEKIKFTVANIRRKTGKFYNELEGK